MRLIKEGDRIRLKKTIQGKDNWKEGLYATLPAGTEGYVSDKHSPEGELFEASFQFADYDPDDDFAWQDAFITVTLSVDQVEYMPSLSENA